ncbi:hypothetical protein [Nonomuraea jabiensis]|uniref:Uncharacterized protein n=1 Tax=Nonomuraea jabiensis TaxID=882448 RepID=A0A7W9L7K2_9ACTN|nr:hypothetical protein [Nonomuraea jabiensis]MBB5773504.1 hypothetical protein [Nonomuraea jabiensis]
MNDFTLGVISSMAATALSVAVGWILSARARDWAVATLSRYSGLGVRKLHHQQRRAADELAADLAKARWVAVLTGRGNELTRDTFAPIWSGAVRPLDAVRVLLPDPQPDSWLVRREESLRRFDRGLRPGMLLEQVRNNAEYVREVASHLDVVELRFYDLPNLYRIILTDEVAYITLYGDTEHGRNSPCVVAQRPGLLYGLALRIFTSTWEASSYGRDGGKRTEGEE